MKKIHNYFKNTLKLGFLILTALVINGAAATFTVTNTNDSGAGSLRQAILDANAAASDDVINFDASFNVPRTITLGGTVLTIVGNGALTINGPGRDLLTVSGNSQSRVFEVRSVDTPTAATVVFNGLTIRDGDSINSGGGGAGIGINNGGSPNPQQASVTVNNATITNNNSRVQAGGGIGCFHNGTLNVNNSIISNNSGNGGGGIAIGSGIGTCLLNINGSEITRNTNQGLICCGNAGNIDVQINISNSTFSYNFGNNGSAIRFGSNNFTTRRITNSTFFGNFGAPAVTVEFNNLILENVTIAGNYFDHPTTTAGLFLVGQVAATSRNSLIANNFNASGGNDIRATNPELLTFTSQGYNLFENIGSTPITGNTTGNLIGVDPLLDTIIRNNGGATPTLNLRPGSPAIDAGDPTTFPATDQRGISRPQDGDGNGVSRSDIGAFEKRVTDILPPAFDFDGDRRTDISIFRPNVGQWWIRRSSDGIVPALPFGQSSDVITPADFTGDGKTDVAFFRPSTGFWYVLRSEDSNFYAFPFGASGDIPTPADFDGDGIADAAVFRPSQAVWYIKNSSDNSTTITPFGIAGDLPVAADYDGDGKADIGIYRPSNGQWWINRSSAGLFVTTFGVSTDKTVQADYTGDGKADVAFWRPSTGLWYILRSEDAQFYAFPFGANGDTPVPGDYDGDGRADAAVFRNSNLIWYLQQSTSGAAIVGFGASGDIPIASAFVR